MAQARKDNTGGWEDELDGDLTRTKDVMRQLVEMYIPEASQNQLTSSLQHSDLATIAFARRIRVAENKFWSETDVDVEPSLQAVVLGSARLVNVMAEVDAATSPTTAVRLVADFAGGQDLVRECCQYKGLWDKDQLLKYMMELAVEDEIQASELVCKLQLDMAANILSNMGQSPVSTKSSLTCDSKPKRKFLRKDLEGVKHKGIKHKGGKKIVCQ